MNSAAMKTFLYCSGGFVVGTLGLIFVAPKHTVMFMENLAFLEVLAGALCFLFKDRL